MNISNFGRLIGAGLLALGLHAFAPSASAQSLAAGLPAESGRCSRGETTGDGAVSPALGGGSPASVERLGQRPPPA